MRSGLARALKMAALGAGSGAVAALVAYAVRKPEPLDLTKIDLQVKVDDLTLSDETWTIVGLGLLGFLVCGSVAVAYVVKKGLVRSMLAFAIAAPLGAFLCWGARWAMDQALYAALGGPSKSVDILQASAAMQLPWVVWQIGVSFGLTMPIVLGIGPNKFTFLRGLLGALFVMVAGELVGILVGILLVPFILAMMFSGGGDATNLARVADVTYLFSMGAGAGIAFAVAEAIYRPAWLKGVRGPSEGRTWAVTGPFARIGAMEGVEVLLPNDGTVAPVHAQIQSQDEAHFLTDLVGSTLVNGSPAQTQWLNDGDQIAVGSALLVYRTRLHQKPKEQPRAVSRLASQPALVDSFQNRHVLKPGANTVGRDPSCDISLTWEASVSRRHAEVVLNQGRVFVRDLGSTNGTTVNGARVASEVELAPGAVVAFGKCEARLET